MVEQLPGRRISLAEVQAHATEIAAIADRCGVRNVRVFGSVARGTADAGSDLDLLVDAEPGTGVFALSAFAAEIESLLGVPTQVATAGGLKPRIRDRVETEAVPV